MGPLLEEPETAAVRSFLANRGARRVSSALPRTESVRAVRHLGPDALATVREGLRRVDLIGIDDRILDAAGMAEAQVLRTRHAIHLATEIAKGRERAPE